MVTLFRHRFRARAAQGLALLGVLGISALVLLFRGWVAGLGGYGYLGGFLVSILGASSIVLPVPNWTVIAALGMALNPWLVGLVCAIGGTIGEMTGYGLGYGGRGVLEKRTQYQRMAGWMRRRGSLTIFILALLPNPLFDAAGIAAGALRFPAWKFILFGGVGRLPKSIFYAHMGIWGWKLFGAG